MYVGGIDVQKIMHGIGTVQGYVRSNVKRICSLLFHLSFLQQNKSLTSLIDQIVINVSLIDTVNIYQAKENESNNPSPYYKFKEKSCFIPS